MTPKDEALHEEDLQALARLMLDHTETAEAFTAAIKATCDTLTRRLDEPVVPGLQGHLDEILQVLRAEKQPARLDWKRLLGGSVGLVLLSGIGGWWIGTPAPGVQQRAVLMEHVNAALLERQSSLPADVKAKLATLYRQYGFPSLDQQGGKR